jgi:hypothetical protein
MQMLAAIATPAAERRSMPVDEMVDAVQADQPDKNEVDGNDVIEQPRHEQNQDTGDKGNERRNMGSGDNHDFPLA